MGKKKAGASQGPQLSDKVYEADMSHWGHDWITIANPTYGSFQSAPFLSDYSKSVDEQRKEEEAVLTPWSGPGE